MTKRRHVRRGHLPQQINVWMTNYYLLC